MAADDSHRLVLSRHLTAAARQTQRHAASEALIYPCQRIACPTRCLPFSALSPRMFDVLHATLPHAVLNESDERSKTPKLDGSKRAMYPDMCPLTP